MKTPVHSTDLLVLHFHSFRYRFPHLRPQLDLTENIEMPLLMPILQIPIAGGQKENWEHWNYHR